MFGSTEKYQTKQGTRWRAVWYIDGGKQSKGGFDREGSAKNHLRALATGLKGGVAETVSWLIDQYLAAKLILVSKQGMELCTYELYRGHLENYVKPDEIGKLKLNDLGTPEINAFLSRLTTHTTLKNAKRIRVSLSTMMKWAVGRGYIKINPVRDAAFEANDARHEIDEFEDFDDVDVNALHIPTPAQARAILMAADDFDKTKRAGAMARLLFNGGLRPSEMLGMPVQLMRIIDGRMHIKIAQRASAKTGEIGRLKNAASKRKLTLGREATLVIQEYLMACGRPQAGLLFPTKNGTALQQRNFHRRIWLPVLGAAGFATAVVKARRDARYDKSFNWSTWTDGQFTPHHGRHFAASSLIASGAKPKRVQAFLGHASLSVTMDVYGHLFPDEARENELADALDLALAGA